MEERKRWTRQEKEKELIHLFNYCRFNCYFAFEELSEQLSKILTTEQIKHLQRKIY